MSVKISQLGAASSVNTADELEINQGGSSLRATAAQILTGALAEAKAHFINDTSNANMAAGLTINGGDNDNQHLCLKNTDVSHGITSAGFGPDLETDDFLAVAKASTAGGGAYFVVAREDDTGTQVYVVEVLGGQAVTTDTTTSLAPILFRAAEHDGANALVNAPTDANLLAVQSWSAGAYTTRMILKADDGELHLGNTTLVALDSENDVMAVRGLQMVRTEGRGIVPHKHDDIAYSYDKLREIGVVGEKDEKGEFLIRIQPYLNLHDGAIWQLHQRVAALETTLERANALIARYEKLLGAK